MTPKDWVQLVAMLLGALAFAAVITVFIVWG